jgi:large subunit ribosomal protein L32
MRATRSARGNRRSHHALANPAVSKDKNDGVVHLRHRASAITGKYKGLIVIDIEKKLARKAKKAKAASAAR